MLSQVGSQKDSLTDPYHHSIIWGLVTRFVNINPLIQVVIDSREWHWPSTVVLGHVQVETSCGMFWHGCIHSHSVTVVRFWERGHNDDGIFTVLACKSPLPSPFQWRPLLVATLNTSYEGTAPQSTSQPPMTAHHRGETSEVRWMTCN